MMRALSISVSWILAGAGIAGALFWAFLNTPESTFVALSVSLLLAIALFLVLSTIACGALVGWATGWRRHVIGPALRGALRSLLAVAFVLAIWWIIGRGLTSLSARSGAISAWFIATFDWSDVRSLIGGMRVVGEWVRLVVAPFVALVWLGDALSRGWRPWVDRAAVRHALSPARLALVTAIAVGTLWAPITYGMFWMPRGMPPTWLEPAVAGVKLGLIALLGAVGLSLIAKLAVRRRA